MDGAKKGVLLIHGLTGSPLEMQPIESCLRQGGYYTRLITLPGHGERPEKRFFETSALEILDHCAAEYERFASLVDEVYIVGHSLGGICTLLTAAVRPPKLGGIVVFSAPYEHAYFYNHLRGLTQMSFPQLVRSIYLAPRDRIVFNRPDVTLWNVPKLLQQTQIMFSLMKEQVGHIQVPVSLAHSIYDLTIPYREMEKLAEVIGRSAPVKTTVLERSGHRIFPVSQDMDTAIQVIHDFLEADCQAMRDCWPIRYSG
ncbi:alpha/beta hydrolase [Vampirovibrio chlorellavorus]|uniref:alpha/beta hydrolase n=1 Tax=Vampirovibrio chlorellavorus TaxID=758823 RepID=UPI0026EB2916|nr:alpha/beta fold hydrolase [Vampirovibrio chlorellavorus]